MNRLEFCPGFLSHIGCSDKFGLGTRTYVGTSTLRTRWLAKQYSFYMGKEEHRRGQLERTWHKDVGKGRYGGSIAPIFPIWNVPYIYLCDCAIYLVRTCVDLARVTDLPT